MTAIVTLPHEPDLVATLSVLERGLDPAHPERTPGLAVLGYGEASVALTLTPLPGLVAKRTAGFRDEAGARAYVALVSEYVDRLTAAGVHVVATRGVVVPRGDRPPVAYLVQPRLDAERLGDRLARDPDPAVLPGALDKVLTVVGQVLQRNGSDPDRVEIAVDAQLSNWWFADRSPRSNATPVLVDVGTPFLRRDESYAIDFEVLLAAGPPPVRPLFRAARILESYFDDYFDPRTVTIDLLGNLHKERVPERIDDSLALVNAWLATAGADPVTRAEVDRYYRSDARLLGLFLGLRRADRRARRLLRQPYDFVLPGAISR